MYNITDDGNGPYIMVGKEQVFIQSEYVEKLLNGCIYEDGEIIETQEYLDYMEAKRVPKELTPRQVRLAMLGTGIDLSMIDSIIDDLSEPQKSQVRIMWEYSQIFKRDDPVLNSFAEQLGLSQEDIDELFINGQGL